MNGEQDGSKCESTFGVIASAQIGSYPAGVPVLGRLTLP